jgi:hypothetical protein
MSPPLDAIGVTLAQRLRGGAGPATALTERGAENALPVLSPLAPLLPGGGLRRGSTVAVHGSASLLLALLAGASRSGAWSAVVGVPTLGMAAAAEAGVVLERLALVPDPGSDLAGVLAALADGMDVVAVGATGRLRGMEVRRLAARARQRGTVLVGFGGWPGAELRLSVEAPVWQGLGDGHGYLRARQVTVRVDGRGSATRPRRYDLSLPALDGGVAEVAPVGIVPAASGVVAVEPEVAWARQAEAV